MFSECKSFSSLFSEHVLDLKTKRKHPVHILHFELLSLLLIITF